MLTFPLGFTLTQSHKLRWEAGGGLDCHTNKHMHKQNPENVQWESRCHFSHVALMGAWRVNILIAFFSQTPLCWFFWGSSPGRGGGKLMGLVLLLTPHMEPLKCPLKRALSITITSKWFKIIQRMGRVVMVTALNTVVNQLLCNYSQNRDYRHRGNQNNRRLVHSVCFNSCFLTKINQIWRYLLYFRHGLQHFKGCDNLYY